MFQKLMRLNSAISTSSLLPISWLVMSLADLSLADLRNSMVVV